MTGAHVINIAFLVGILTQLTKLPELLLSSDQRKNIEGKIDMLTLKIDGLDPAVYIRSLLSNKKKRAWFLFISSFVSFAVASALVQIVIEKNNFGLINVLFQIIGAINAYLTTRKRIIIRFYRSTFKKSLTTLGITCIPLAFIFCLILFQQSNFGPITFGFLKKTLSGALLYSL